MRQSAKALLTSLSLMLPAAPLASTASGADDMRGGSVPVSKQRAEVPESYDIGTVTITRADNPFEHKACTALIEAGWRLSASKTSLTLTARESGVSVPITISERDTLAKQLVRLAGATETLEKLDAAASPLKLSFTVTEEGLIQPTCGDLTLRSVSPRPGSAADQASHLLEMAEKHKAHPPFAISVGVSAKVTMLPLDAVHNPKETMQLLSAARKAGLTVVLTASDANDVSFMVRKQLPDADGLIDDLQIGRPIVISRTNTEKITVEGKDGKKVTFSDYFDVRDYRIAKSLQLHLENPPITVKGSSYPIDVVSAPRLHRLATRSDLVFEAKSDRLDKVGETNIVTCTVAERGKYIDRPIGTPIKVYRDFADFVDVRNKLLESMIIGTNVPPIEVFPTSESKILGSLQIHPSLFPLAGAVLDDSKKYKYGIFLAGATKDELTFEITRLKHYGQLASNRLTGFKCTIAREDFNDPKLRDPAFSKALVEAFAKDPILKDRKTMDAAIATAHKRADGIKTFVTRGLALDDEERNQGLEARYGYAVLEKLKTVNVQGARWELEAIAIPTLHTLQDIHQRYPTYLQQLADDGDLDRFAGGVAKILLDEMRLRRQGTLLDKDSVVVAFVANDKGFSTTLIEDVAKKCKVPEERIFAMKGADKKDSGATEKKTWLLGQLGDAAARKDRSTFIWVFGHGLQDQDTLKSTTVADARGVLRLETVKGIQPAYIAINSGFGADDDLQMQEIAERLVTKCNGGRGDVDLSRITLALDSCYAYPEKFDATLQGRIVKVAQRSGRNVVGLPIVYTGGTRGSVDYMFQRKEEYRTEVSSEMQWMVLGEKITNDRFVRWIGTSSSSAMFSANDWEVKDIRSGGKTYRMGAVSMDPTMMGGTVTTDAEIFRAIEKELNIKGPKNPSRIPRGLEWSLLPLDWRMSDQAI